MKTIKKRTDLISSEIENLYLQEGMTVRKLMKIYKTSDRTISKILKDSSNIKINDKLLHPNKGVKHINHFRKNEGKLCEICNSDEHVCYNVITNKYLCGRHRCQISEYGRILEKTQFDSNKIIIYDTYAEIILENIKYKEVGRALISLDKLDLIRNYKWHLRNDKYVETKVKRQNILLHMLIMKDKYNINTEQPDHINRNRMDNRNENLRISTLSQNGANKGISIRNTSGIIGVTWDKNRDKWKVMITYQHKHMNIGRYDNFEDAVFARLEAEKKHFGEFAPQRHLFEQYHIA